MVEPVADDATGFVRRADCGDRERPVTSMMAVPVAAAVSRRRRMRWEVGTVR